MGLQLTVLGCHSATPRKNAFPTAQFLSLDNRYGFLIDCGEGTQTRLRENGIGFSKIKQIFISHLHGDHFLGLVGLLSTMSMLSRETPLTIHAPKGIKEIVAIHMKHCGFFVGYDLHFNELSSKKSERIYEDEKITVSTIPLQHRIYTNGFLFREKMGLRKLNMDFIDQNSMITKLDYTSLKKGKDFVCAKTGFVIPNEKLTLPPFAQKSYAFCSDTAYLPEIIPLIKEVDLLYHESTFLQEHTDKAKNTAHTTARQAAEIAQKAGVKHLLLGHYSSRYKDISKFKTEAETVFSSVQLSKSGLQISL